MNESGPVGRFRGWALQGWGYRDWAVVTPGTWAALPFSGLQSAGNKPIPHCMAAEAEEAVSRGPSSVGRLTEGLEGSCSGQPLPTYDLGLSFAACRGGTLCRQLRTSARVGMRV